MGLEAVEFLGSWLKAECERSRRSATALSEAARSLVEGGLLRRALESAAGSTNRGLVFAGLRRGLRRVQARERSSPVRLSAAAQTHRRARVLRLQRRSPRRSRTLPKRRRRVFRRLCFWWALCKRRRFWLKKSKSCARQSPSTKVGGEQQLPRIDVGEGGRAALEGRLARKSSKTDLRTVFAEELLEGRVEGGEEKALLTALCSRVQREHARGRAPKLVLLQTERSEELALTELEAKAVARPPALTVCTQAQRKSLASRRPPASAPRASELPCLSGTSEAAGWNKSKAFAQGLVGGRI